MGVVEQVCCRVDRSLSPHHPIPPRQDFSNKSLYFSVTFNMESHLWNTLLQYFAKENMTNKNQMITTTCPFDNLSMLNRFILSHQIKANIFFSNCPANVCTMAEVKHSTRSFYIPRFVDDATFWLHMSV